MRFFLVFLLISAILCDDASKIKSSFVSFDSENDLYNLLYEAKLAGILDSDANFNSQNFITIIQSKKELYDLAVNNGIIVLGSQFSSAGLNKYVKSDLALYNMLIRVGILDSKGEFSQEGLKSVLTRYNPTTKQLDPVEKKSIEQTEIEKEKNESKPISQPLENFSLNSLQDIYKFVLKCYKAGIFDKDGNFIETSFANLLKKETKLAEMLKQNQLIDDNFKVNFGVLYTFIEERPAIASLLSESNIYRNNVYSKKAVSDIIFRYNEQTGLLDLQPVLPVVEQIELDSSENDEVTEKEKAQEKDGGFDDMSLADAIKKLIEDPVTYLRDFIVYLRKYAIFSSEGYFDSFFAYSTLSSDPTISEIIKKYKLYDDNAQFSTSNLLAFVKANPTLEKACETLGILVNDYYNQEAVTAIVASYPSSFEEKIIPFTVSNPLTAQTTEDVMVVLKRLYTLKIIDKEGLLDIPMLQKAMEDDAEFMNTVLSASVLQGNTFSTPHLRMAIIAHPKLRDSLCQLGILNSVGDLDKTAFTRAICRAANLEMTNTSSPQAETDTKQTTDRDRTEEAESKLSVPKSQISFQIATSFKGSINRSRNSSSTSSNEIKTSDSSVVTRITNNFNWIAFIIVSCIILGVALLITGIVILVRKKGRKDEDDNKDDDFHLV